MCVCVCVVDLLFVRVRDIYICSTLNLSLQCVSLFLLLFVLFFALDANCVCVLSSRFFATIRLAFTRVYHCQASCFVCCRCQPYYFAFVME